MSHPFLKLSRGSLNFRACSSFTAVHFKDISWIFSGAITTVELPYPVADPGGGGVITSVTPPPQLMQSVRDRADHPPPPGMSKAGCLSIFRRAEDDGTRAMSKGGGGVLVSVLTPPFRKSCIRAYLSD